MSAETRKALLMLVLGLAAIAGTVGFCMLDGFCRYGWKP